MESQQDNSSEVKTHDEILRLFKDLEIMEAKVKNPEKFVEVTLQPETLFQEAGPPPQSPTEAMELKHHMQPASEVPQRQEEEHRRSFWRRDHQAGVPTPTESITTDQHKQDVRTPRSTFILQLDTNGNLIGLPVKKPKPIKETNLQEEPVTGIKGKLKQIGFLFRRRETQEDDSSEGIGARLIGIFRRE